MQRIFIGIKIDSNFLSDLDEELAYLKSTHPHIKWSSKDKLHLTIAFIGEINQIELPNICSELKNALQDFKSFSFELSGVGLLPNSNAPRTIYADISLGRYELLRLNGAISAVLKNLCNIKPEPKFIPHVTMGKITKKQSKKEITEIIGDLENVDLGVVDVEEVSVFKSELHSNGSVYTVIDRIKLNF